MKKINNFYAIQLKDKINYTSSTRFKGNFFIPSSCQIWITKYISCFSNIILNRKTKYSKNINESTDVYFVSYYQAKNSTKLRTK